MIATALDERSMLDSGYSWFVAGVALLIASVSFGAVTSIPILLKPIASELGWSRGVLSFGHLLAMFGAAAGGLLMGRLLDKHGFFRIALFAGFATGAGLIVAGSMTSVWQLYCAYGLLIGAAGQGAFFSPLAAAVSLWFDRHRALAISIASCGQSIGGLIAPPVLRICAEQFGWRPTLQIFGLLAILLVTVCSLAFLRKPPQKTKQAIRTAASLSPSLPQFAAKLERGEFAVLGVALGLSNLATFVVVGHITAFGEDMGFSPIDSAALLAAFLGVTLISRLAYGFLTDRWGKYSVLVGVCVVQVLGVGVLAAASTYNSMLIGVILIGLGFGGYIPGYAVTISDMFPTEQAGRRIGEIYFFAFISAGIGSWSGGVLRDITGSYSLAFYGAFLTSTLGLLVLLSRRRSLGQL